MKFQLYLLLIVTLVSSFSHSYEEQVTLPAWRSRPYVIYVPDEIKLNPTNQSYPLVFSLHGASSNAKEQQLNTCKVKNLADSSCLDRLADRQKFIVVYPNGSKMSGGECIEKVPGCIPRYWNQIKSCSGGITKDLNKTETDYLLSVLRDVQSKHPILDNGIFFSGMSNGSQMSYEASCRLRSKVSAVALIAGTGGLEFDACSCKSRKEENSSNPALIQFHGTKDPLWSYKAANQFIIRVAQTSGCAKIPTISSQPDLDKKDGTTAKKYEYQNCKNDIIHYQIDGAGHTWPGGLQYLDPKKIGLVTYDINANEIMWEFFKSHMNIKK